MLLDGVKYQRENKSGKCRTDITVSLVCYNRSMSEIPFCWGGKMIKFPPSVRSVQPGSFSGIRQL